MAFLDFLKKKEVPDELPDLATDELEKNLQKESGGSADPMPETESDFPDKVPDRKEIKEVLEKKAPAKSANEFGYSSDKKDDKDTYASQVKKVVLDASGDNDRSFFSELQKDLHESLTDTDKMESLYNRRFVTKDILSDMRNYWEEQKNTTILNNLAEDMKERINEKTEHLQELEKDWQSIYFELAQKEDEMKEEEEELKNMLADFMSIYKKKQRKPVKNNASQKKSREKEHK
jgi:hypothetical protein